MKTPVSKAFRMALINEFPALKNRPYMYLFRNLLLRSVEKTERDEYYNAHLLTHHWLALINQKDWTNFRSGEFLNAFKRDVLPDFEWTDYKEREKARTVKNYGIPDKAYKILHQHLDEEPEVWLETGTKLTNTRVVADDYERMIGFANTLADIYEISPQAKNILDYHNSLPRQMFTSAVRRNLTSAERAVLALQDNESVYTPTRETLKRVVAYSKPVLVPKSSTDRLFGQIPDLTRIKSSVRKALTKGWWEADLKSAQLAIAAKVWDIPQIQTFLAEGGSIWANLMIGFDGDKDSVKAACKTALYSILYGGGEKNVRAALEEDLVGTGFDADTFLQNPLIIALISRQKEVMDEIMLDPKDHTKKGVPINPLDQTAITGKPHERMALLAQAYELLLIHEMYLVQKKYSNVFTISLYQFDGVSINWIRPERRDAMIKKLNKAVAAKAKELGIHTALEWEEIV